MNLLPTKTEGWTPPAIHLCGRSVLILRGNVLEDYDCFPFSQREKGNKAQEKGYHVPHK